ncbi:NAD(P)H-dependent oxidoreductase [Enterococcus faecalis]|uniref:NAD(P)H-dependent oxidoreductase n=1 Tax=Enterococcus faecalis TaxID=1351 RepID=UPI00287F8E58|nr:NAD(P)H-dependent oxidoreductase [Enterococcus faecalis]
MKTTIVFAHPWHGSFNKAILDQVTTKLKELNRDYNLIDLYKDKFNPALQEKDLALFSQGLSTDPLVDRYIDMLKETDNIIFIFPIWWYEAPAIIKGFFDKVLLVNRLGKYNDDRTKIIPFITMKKSIVITTSEVTTETLEKEQGDPIGTVLFKGVMENTGMFNRVWMNLGRINFISSEDRTAFLEQVSNSIE